jgi:hypothetical protein
MALLAEKAGMKAADVVYDSTEFQFWGSEQYLRNIPLCSARSYGNNPAKSLFTRSDIRQFRKQAKRLNFEKQGDQAAFYVEGLKSSGGEGSTARFRRSLRLKL